MKRNGWEIAYIVWIVLVVGLMLFWPARAAEDAERTENHTEITPECTERAIEAKPDEEPENEYIEAALYASGYFREDVPLDGDTQAFLRAGCDYLAELLGKYPLEEALTAYNSGKPGKSAYASNVLAYMEAYYGD